MAINVRIIPITEFLRTDVSGNLDLTTSRDLFCQMMAASKQQNVDRILIDTREATSDASVLDVWTLFSDMKVMGLTPEYRVAVVNQPKDNFDRGAFLETCATNRGYQLRAFRDFEAAFTWLTAGGPSPDW